MGYLLQRDEVYLALDVDSIFGTLFFVSIPINFICLVRQAFLSAGDPAGWVWLGTLSALLCSLGVALVLWRHERRKERQLLALDTLAGALVGSLGYSTKLKIAFEVFDHYGEGTSRACRVQTRQPRWPCRGVQGRFRSPLPCWQSRVASCSSCSRSCTPRCRATC